MTFKIDVVEQCQFLFYVLSMQEILAGIQRE